MAAESLYYQVKHGNALKAVVVTAVTLITATLFAVPMAPQARVVRYEPIASKSMGPIGISVSYPLDHALNEPLEVSLYGWASGGKDVESLNIKARVLSDNLKWQSGDKERTFEGPIKNNESRNFRFSITPTSKGDGYIAIDVSYPEKGKRQSRTEVILIKAGGKIERSDLNRGKIKAARIEMY